MNKRSKDVKERQRKILQESGLFDAEFYLKMYSDVAEAGHDPLSHYLEHGALQNRNPNLMFNESYYVSQCSEPISSGVCALLHYILKGWYQINPHPLFDTRFYLSQCPELADSMVTPLAHFLSEGNEAGYLPCKEFDASFYLKQYPEVESSGMTPFMHFLKVGALKGYDPSPGFDTSFYVIQDPELLESGENPLAHFIWFGRSEKRPCRNHFFDAFHDKLLKDYAKLCCLEAQLPAPETLPDLVLGRPLHRSRAGSAYRLIAAAVQQKFKYLIVAERLNSELVSAMNELCQQTEGALRDEFLLILSEEASPAASSGFVCVSLAEPGLLLSDKLKVLMRLIIQARPEKMFSFGSLLAQRAAAEYPKQLQFCTAFVEMNCGDKNNVC